MSTMGGEVAEDLSAANSTPFQRLLRRWLEQAPPSLAETARLAALPHSFELPLLSLLRGTDMETTELVATLITAGLLAEIEPHRFAVPADFRCLLLHGWQHDDKEGYRRACSQAIEYWHSRPSSPETGDPGEFVYLQLGADDVLGIDTLSTALERAWGAGRLGLAASLLAVAEEQVPVLGDEARAWVQYFHAYLELLHVRPHQSEVRIRQLMAGDPSRRLRAHALALLGAVHVQQQQWAEAHACHLEALGHFKELGDRLSAGRVLESEALAYLQLATNQGGLPQEWGNPGANIETWLHRVQHAPFVLYRYCSRRFAFLPNVYYGANYQDWIILRLLFAAIECLEQAIAQLSGISLPSAAAVDQELSENRIRLADLTHRVGRWSAAERQFRELTTTANVQESENLQALLYLSQGRAAVARADASAARDFLRKSWDVFSSYEDERSLAVTARLLGDAEVLDGNAEAAVPIYIESIQHALATNDLLMATDVWSLLNNLVQRTTLSTEATSQLEVLAQAMERRAYIARFPGRMLERFRWLAEYVALPLTYLIFWLLAIQAPLPLAVLDVILLNSSPSTALLIDLAGGILYFLGFLFGLLWFHELLYALAGWLYVRRLSLGDGDWSQPLYVITVPDGMALRTDLYEPLDVSLASVTRFARPAQPGRTGLRADEGHRQDIQEETAQQISLLELSWNRATRVVTVDRCLWRAPVALFSAVFLTSATVNLAIPGIINHYRELRRDIQARLQAAGSNTQQDILKYSFLSSPWSLIALLVTVILVIVTIFDWLDPTCQAQNIQLVSLRGGSYGYLVDGQGDLLAVDIYDPNNLRVLGILNTPGETRAAAVDDQYIYLIDGLNARLRIIDSSVPEMLHEVGTAPVSREATALGVAGHHVYVADHSGGLQAIDVSDPAAPVLSGIHNSPGEIFDLSVIQNRVYIAGGSEGLRVVDFAEPNAPIEVGHFITRGAVWSVVVAGEYAHLVGEDGFQVVDIADPAAMIEVAFSVAPAGATNVEHEAGHTFIAAPGGGLWVFNMADPTNPILVRTYSAPGKISDFMVSLAYVFLAAENGGLRVVDFIEPCDGAVEAGTLAVAAGVHKIAMLKPYPLPITSVVYESLRWGLLIFPLFGLAHLLHHRTRERRLLGTRFRFDAGADWSIGFAFALFLVWTLYEIGKLRQ